MADKKETEQTAGPEDEVLEGVPARTAPARSPALKALEGEPEEELVSEDDLHEAEALAEDDDDDNYDDDDDEDDDDEDDDDEDDDDEDDDEEDDDDEDDDELGYQVKLKPVLDPATATALALRRRQQSKRPAFKRQEWHRYQRLGQSWRRPKGLHSKQRRGLRYRSPTVKAGYSSNNQARGLHPSGFEEVLVHNVAQLEGLDPERQAIRIGGAVGLRKREAIQEQAAVLRLRVLNPTTKRLRYRQLELALSRGEL